jgi:hypothetical protein
MKVPWSGLADQGTTSTLIGEQEASKDYAHLPGAVELIE